jgi:hypothetical protein
MRTFLIAAICGLSAIGCVQPATEAEIAAADYGPEPTQEQAEHAIRLWMRHYLKDPGSVTDFEAKWQGSGYLRQAPLAGGATFWGWRYEASWNAKNSYGGYVGITSHAFVIKNGYVIGHVPASNLRQ